MDDKEKQSGGLEKLEKDLYSREKEQIMGRERREFRQHDFGIPDEWKDVDDVETFKTRKPLVKIILLASLAFFALSTVFAAIFFFQGTGISPKNIVIEIRGPAQIGGGEELSLQIKVQNNNPVPIETADLIVEYPAGTHSASNIDVELPRYRELLGTINPGEEAVKTIEAVLFGEENTIKDIVVRVEYRVSGSNAIFYVDSTYQLTLSSSPLSLVIESFDEAISGQEIEFTAVVRSNSASVIRNAMLEVEYPFGFEFGSARPAPIFANKVWFLGDIPPEGEKKVTFTGDLSGQDGEERVFRFTTGIQSEKDENAIGAEFVSLLRSLLIKRPFITAELVLNGKTGDFIAESGKDIRADIFWTNNLPTQIFDGEIEVAFSGSAVDKTSITADSGFYRSIDNKIIWTRDTKSELGSIPTGDSGKVSFGFAPLSSASGVQLRNPVIDLAVSIRGKRLSDANVPEEIESTLSRQIKVASNLTLASKLLHFTGPFTNTGPTPPEAEKETTYTVVLGISNSSNTIANARVILTLPPYVEWLGQVSPASEEITFSPVGGQIIWDAGDINAGVGVSTSPRELAFQIKFVPSISQIGQAPILVNEQSISGFDRFAEIEIKSSRPALNLFLQEPGFDPNTQGRVVP